MGDERNARPAGDRATVVSTVGARIDVARRVGGRVGAVVLDAPIGEGGMGVVWKGRHEILGREVAVKFLTDAVEEGDPGFAAFVEGARACAAVRHEGLVQVFDAGVVSIEAEGSAGSGLPSSEGKVDGEEGIKASGIGASSADRSRIPGSFRVPYLVMELVDGPGLDHVLRVCGAMSLGATLAVMGQVCEAIGELHAAGFVHRDIKPGNILLDSDGRVHVTDFGLACERSMFRSKTTDPQSRVRGTGAISGTPVYMAPEMFQGEVSARSDVYALAVMMFELLTGEVPFRGDVLEVKRLHEAAPVPRAGLEARGVSAAVIEVIERGMVKNAMIRPRSAAHWLESLHAAVQDRGVWEAGARELKGLVAKAQGEEPRGMGAGDSTSYYRTIAERAEEKRKVVEEEAIVEPGAPTPDTAVCVCGYSLKGLCTTGKCPECGGWIRASLAKGPLPCVMCGYDLVGIEEAGKCPECGRAVRESVWPSRLLFADSEWLKRVAMGLRLMVWGLWLMPVLMVAVGIVSLVFLGSSPQGAAWKAVELAVQFGLITAVVLSTIGLVNATAQEPGMRSGRGMSARWAWLSGVGLALLGMVVTHVEPTVPEWVFELPAVHLLLIGVVLFAATVERLGERLPDSKLMKSARSVFVPWAGMVVASLAVTVSRAGWAAGELGIDEVQLLSGALLIGLIFSAVLAGMARRRVAAVARVARPRAVARPIPTGRRKVVMWRAIGWSVLAFSVAVVPLFLLGPWLKLAEYRLAEALGMLEAPVGTTGSFRIEVAGREFAGRPPMALTVVMTIVMVAAMYGVPVALGFWVYMRKGLSRPRGDGATRCGWCGFELRGLREARCPECGVEIGGEPREGESAQALSGLRWWGAMALRAACAGAVFPVVLGLVVMSVVMPLGLMAPGATAQGVALILLTHVPAFVAALAVFHLAARGVAGLRGKTWCGKCGEPMRGGACGCGNTVVGAAR